MTINTQSPLSIFTGQAAQVRLISRSHGAVRPNLVQSVDYTPKGSIKQVDEWDNPEPALLYQTFDGGSGKISFDLSNQGLIEAMLMDTDPTVAPAISLDPANYRPFTVALNHKDQTGRIVGSSLLKGCLGLPVNFSGTVKDGAKGDLNFQFLNAFRFPGLALQYTRATYGTASQTVPSAPSLATSTTAGYLVAGMYYVKIVAKTAAGTSLASAEAAIIVPAGTSTNKVTVTTPAPAGSITSYDVYCSNYSNGERFVGNDAGSTTYVITTLPAQTAATVPQFDTTGVPQMTDDKIFAGSPKAITLANTAYFLPQTGLGYALVLKNGNIVAAPNAPATDNSFYVKTDGTQFILNATPAVTDWWDIFTLYQP